MSNPVSQSAPITFRCMTEADIPFGMHLKTQAGWNQTEADWRRFLMLAPEGCYIAEVDGQPAGTAVAVCFGAVAWVGMVLVDETQRGRGIGTAIMRHALVQLDAKGIQSIRLDATHLGEPIYRKLGFEAQFQLARLHRPPHARTKRPQEAPLGVAHQSPTPPSPPLKIISAAPASLDSLAPLATLDQQVTRTDRRALLECLVHEQPQWSWLAHPQNNHRDNDKTAAEPIGYLLMRPGSYAVQVGPAIAHDDQTAIALLATALDALDALGDEPPAAFIDVPIQNTAILDWLTAQGFTEQRRFTRMTRGQSILENVSHLLASTGPEKG